MASVCWPLPAIGLSSPVASAATAEHPPTTDKPQIWVNLGGFSRHFETDKGYN